MPGLIKDQFAKLKGLLDRLRDEMSVIEGNSSLVGELRELSVALVSQLAKDRKSKQVDEISRMIRSLLKMSTL